MYLSCVILFDFYLFLGKLLLVMHLVQFPFADQYDWEKRELIGQGGFANVYKVKNKKTGVQFAVKQLLMHKFDADFKIQALNTEIKAMSECQDASIVKMYKSQKCKNYTYLIMELCQQNLKEYMQKKLMLSQKQAAEVISNIVESYKTLINKQYLHRDLKPKNILLKNGKFKLTDFGFAKKYSFNQQQLIEVCGTPLYMAPQLLYSKPYTDKCDVWSLGLILYQLLFGYPPFSTRYYQTYKKQVVSRDVSFPYNYQIGQNTKDLIQRCLQLEESDRIGWKQVFSHPFVKDKNPGKTVIYRQVNVNVQNILGRIQLSNYRDYTNAKKLFKNLEKYSQVGQKLFYQLLIELDPQITTYESNQIFQAADESHNGIINMNQFKKFYLQIDYRPAQDVASKRLQEIIRIAQAKKMKGLDIFKALDFNKSNKLEKAQFFIMVKKIAPMLEQREKQLIWKKLDKDSSGDVTWKQFLSSTIRDLTVNQKVHFKNYERAVRNVFCLRQFFQQRGVTSEQLFKVKKGSSNLMTLDQFAGMTKSINYAISRDEIVEMFRLIDSNNSESIQAGEIQKLLKGEISM